MERENNASKKIDTRTKFVNSAANSCNNIQPRVVLERLGKDYILGAGTSSDSQPSTSGYSNRGRKQSGSGVSGQAGQNNLNNRNNDLAIPSTSRSNNPTTNSRGNGVIQFKVAKLTDVDPDSSSDEGDSDSSYHSSPGQLVILDEDNSDIDVDDDERAKPNENNSESNTSEVTNIREEYRKILVTGSRSKVQKATTFLNLLVCTYSKPYRGGGTESVDDLEEGQIGRRIIRVPRRPQCNNLKDCIVRVRLPVCGEKTKRRFHVKLSQLIYLLKKRSHPLHRFCNALTSRSLNYLLDDEIESMARVLSDFVCAELVDLDVE